MDLARTLTTALMVMAILAVICKDPSLAVVRRSISLRFHLQRTGLMWVR